MAKPSRRSKSIRVIVLAVSSSTYLIYGLEFPKSSFLQSQTQDKENVGLRQTAGGKFNHFLQRKDVDIFL